MKDIITELENWGCDVNGALARFIDDRELYEACLETVVEDENFQLLGKALAEHNVQAAFDCAHTLKGVLANMGLTPILNVVVSIVEPLRAGSDEGLEPKYEQLLELKDKLKEMISE